MTTKTLAEQLAWAYDLPLSQAKGIEIMVKGMIAEEREACAKIADALAADTYPFTHPRDTCEEIADRIRARGNP